MTPMIVEHPLLQHKLSILRNKQTGTKEFRDLVGEIATLLCYEATRDLPLEEVEIETPITMAKTKVLAGRKLALVPILRAGMGMLDGMLTLLPAAKVGFIGLYRDEETLQPVEYFCKLPKDIAERDVLVLDPMLATGGSAIDAITQIKKHGAKRIKFIGLIAAPEGIEALHKVEVPSSWADAEDEPQEKRDLPEFITEVQEVMNRQEGDKLPVSKFAGDRADGTYPLGGAAYEKRGTAINVPVWNAQKCIGCNKCSYVCPHASIRPVLTTDEELAAAPEGFPSKEVRAVKDYHFTVAVSTMDCLGCGNCAQVCPVKALDMTPLDDDLKAKQAYFDYGVDTEKVAPKKNPMKKETVIGSQFEQPLIEFSGACAGCGETPYAKLITQLFGDRMMIANATGCTSIWGGSAPAMPYTTNAKGHGLGQLPVRGQRRVRPRHVPRHAVRPQRPRR